MSIQEWLFWLIPETLKYLIITYGIFGLDITKSKKKYLTPLYLIIGIPLVQYTGISIALYETMWGLLLLLLCFDAKKGKIIQIFLIEYITISVLDILIWSLYLNTIHNGNDGTWEYRLCEVFAIIVWIVITLFTYKRRKYINTYVNEMSKGYFAMVVLFMFGMGIMVGSVQLGVQEDTSDSLREVALFVSTVTMAMNIIVEAVLIYNIYTKKRMELEIKYDNERLLNQEKYYAKLLEKEEGMRSFRHDIRKHLNTLAVLCNEGNFDEVRAYIDEFTNNYKQNETIKTGNKIADFFISDCIDKINVDNSLTYEVVGKFPEEMAINNNQFSILIANAMDNAREAMEKVEGNKQLFIEIKSFKGKTFLSISNSSNEPESGMLKTSKRDKEMHGYGTKNMKSVIEKCGGEIKWNYENGMFFVKMTF